MRWQLKARIGHTLGGVPGGRRIWRLLQAMKGSFPFPEAELDKRMRAAVRVADVLQARLGEPLERLSIYEFGAGWEMIIPLTLAARGVGHQTVIDIQRLIEGGLVDRAWAHLGKRLGARDAETVPGVAGVRRPEAPRNGQPVTEWLATAGIEYRSPADARRMAEEAGAFDAAHSTYTLEHIPPADIEAIYRESFRLIRPGGIHVGTVDHSDHYSHDDPSIGPYHFLRFSPTEWRRYDTPFVYQNRLRSDWHLAALEAAGFTIETAERVIPEPRPRDVEVHPETPRGRALEDTLTTELFFVARRP